MIINNVSFHIHFKNKLLYLGKSIPYVMDVKNEKELAKAIKNNQNEITIKGDLAEKTMKIKATGKVAWVIAIGAVGVATIIALKSPAIVTGGPTALVSIGGIATTSAGAAIAIWGVSTTVTAISICVAGGNVTVLKKLYEGYNIVSKGNGFVKLKKI